MNVVDEIETIERLLDGCSIARYGDGEFNLAFGLRDEVFENRGEQLAERLLEVLGSTVDDLLIGVPNIFSDEAKERLSNPAFWAPYEALLSDRLDPGRVYYSAFISRPDNVVLRAEDDPPEASGGAKTLVPESYWESLRRLWHRRTVAMVHFDEATAHHPLFDNAESINWIPCERRGAWGESGEAYAGLKTRCLEAPESLVLASVGPVATVLAHDLCVAGKQCVDLGQVARIHNLSRGLDHLHLH